MNAGMGGVTYNIDNGDCFQGSDGKILKYQGDAISLDVFQNGVRKGTITLYVYELTNSFVGNAKENPNLPQG